jgi:hypothetical protein
MQETLRLQLLLTAIKAKIDCEHLRNTNLVSKIRPQIPTTLPQTHDEFSANIHGLVNGIVGLGRTIAGVYSEYMDLFPFIRSSSNLCIYR